MAALAALAEAEVTTPKAPVVAINDAAPDDRKSSKALAEFKYACKEYLPRMNGAHLREAIEHCVGFAKSEAAGKLETAS